MNTSIYRYHTTIGTVLISMLLTIIWLVVNSHLTLFCDYLYVSYLGQKMCLLLWACYLWFTVIMLLVWLNFNMLWCYIFRHQKVHYLYRYCLVDIHYWTCYFWNNIYGKLLLKDTLKRVNCSYKTTFASQSNLHRCTVNNHLICRKCITCIGIALLTYTTEHVISEIIFT
jgi:hypothetical protein